MLVRQANTGEELQVCRSCFDNKAGFTIIGSLGGLVSARDLYVGGRPACVVCNPGGPLRVTSAEPQQGWDPWKVTDDSIETLVGRHFPSVAAAETAGDEVYRSPFFLELSAEDGRRYRFDSSWNYRIPGRSVQRVTLLP